HGLHARIVPKAKDHLREGEFGLHRVRCPRLCVGMAFGLAASNCFPSSVDFKNGQLFAECPLLTRPVHLVGRRGAGKMESTSEVRHWCHDACIRRESPCPRYPAFPDRTAFSFTALTVMNRRTFTCGETG